MACCERQASEKKKRKKIQINSRKGLSQDNSIQYLNKFINRHAVKCDVRKQKRKRKYK
jgi:hypothetical protein